MSVIIKEEFINMIASTNLTRVSVIFQDKMALHVYSVNGKHLHSEHAHSHINHMIIAERYLITGNQHGVLGIKELAG